MSTSKSALPDRVTTTDYPWINSRVALAVGGISLILAAVGFIAVFAYLAARFNYPDVLDGQADSVLPELLALGNAGRAVWFIYALIPLLLIPASIGLQAAFSQRAPSAMRVLPVVASISALSMLLGLARWPTIHWQLAEAYAFASPDTRVALGATFSGLNLFLGNFIGEFLGELMLNLFFILSALGFLRHGKRVAAFAGISVGILGMIAALRNVTSAVAMIAEINNYVLPVWLVILGMLMLGLATARISSTTNADFPSA